jgi:hypothetical protein
MSGLGDDLEEVLVVFSLAQIVGMGAWGFWAGKKKIIYGYSRRRERCETVLM